jgi:hypothetical protein
MEANLAKPKEVFVHHMPIYNKLLHFFPGVSIEEKHMSVRTPFLQKFGPFVMEDSSGFSAILLLFLAEVVRFDWMSLGRVHSIYCNKKNAQGLIIEL